jgi:hypothetical protein
LYDLSLVARRELLGVMAATNDALIICGRGSGSGGR